MGLDWPCQYIGCDKLARRADGERRNWHPEDKRPAFCQEHKDGLDNDTLPYTYIDDHGNHINSHLKAKGPATSTNQNSSAKCSHRGCMFPGLYATCAFCSDHLCSQHAKPGLILAPSTRLCGDCSEYYRKMVLFEYWLIRSHRYNFAIRYAQDPLDLPQHIQDINMDIYLR